MIFELKSKEDTFVQGIYDKAMGELNEFFGINWVKNKPRLYLVKDRKTFDNLREGKTDDWVVGWVEGSHKIYVLDRANYENESVHEYSDEKYSALIKHEMAHAFTLIISEGGISKPKWLWEGLAVYLSGQNKFKENPGKFCEFLNYYDEGGKGVYGESGFAVGFLVEKYGKEKLLELLRGLKDIESEEEFGKRFEEIYGFELGYDNFGV